MLIVNTLLAFSSIVAFLLALLILVANSKRTLNRVSFLFNLNIFFWLLFNLLTNLSANPDTSLLFARLVLIPTAFIPLSFLVFVKVYVKQPLSRRLLLFYAILPALLILLTPTELNIVSIKAYGADTVLGFAYIPLLLEFIIYFSIGLWGLRRYYKSPSTASAGEQEQIKYIFLGVILTLVPGLICNIILPITGLENAVFYGPIFAIFLALFTTLAIVRHRFLDIRLVVARSIAYILSLATIALIFSVIAFGFFARVLGNSRLAQYNDLVYIVLAICLAITYQPLRRFFNRITNRLFYRDAYDPQALFNELNNVLVASIELDKILTQSAAILEKHIKPSYTAFFINQKKEDKTDQTRFISFGLDNRTSLEQHFIDHVKKELTVKIAVVDEQIEVNPRLGQAMIDNDISIAIKLMSANQHESNIGYFIIGTKKSGNLYNKDDVRVLEIIADELVIAIQNALRFEEIQQFNITLQQKVDEATRQLRKTNEKLRQLDETKDDFISMASHQLRTPLTSVKGYVSMVLEGDAGKITKQQHKLLDQAFVSSQRMVFLIADLLNVSRLKTGKFIIEPAPTNLAEVVSGEIEQLKETAKGRGLTLEFTPPKHFPTLNLDETKIRQVIMNFTDNAIYYTPSGGTITVSLADKPDSVEFTVVDNGIGVPKAEQHHLFNKFYRAGNAKKARPDGTGLGLFMAQKVIVAQGGAIIFHSEEGKGSTFGFSFPKAKLLAKDGAKPLETHAGPPKKEAKPTPEEEAEATLTNSTPESVKSDKPAS